MLGSVVLPLRPATSVAGSFYFNMASGKKKRRGIQGDTPGVPRVTRSQTDQQQQPVAAAGTTNNRDDPPPVGRIAVDGSTGQPSSQTPPGGPEVLAAIFDAPATTVGNTVAVAAAVLPTDRKSARLNSSHES